SASQMPSSYLACLVRICVVTYSNTPVSFFLFISPAPSAISTLSLHDALSIFPPPPRATARARSRAPRDRRCASTSAAPRRRRRRDRKSTRLNSSHVKISYAVFCLKKKIVSSILRQLFHPQPTPGRYSCSK